MIGYARVSTAEQELGGQLDALAAAGCLRVFTDHVSGVKRARPELEAALDYLREGDVLVVWRLDRLGRSLPHLIELVQGLGERGVQFRSLTEAIDTTTPTGRLLFHVAGAFAQFERDLVRERTMVGLAAARSRGRVGGRPSVMTPARTAEAVRLRAEGQSFQEIAQLLGVGRSSVIRALNRVQSSPSS
ncbi:recombinase family protein [Actinomyces mediterranea]|nr:recombinase family protein [Actinomyces mediterranea]